MTSRTLTALIAALAVTPLCAERVVPLNYGHFNQWITRHISESGVIGGNDKTLYEIGPTATLDGNTPFVPKSNCPWATSNVYAKVVGVSKGSNAVFPDTRSGSDRCAKLTSFIERCKAIGIINIDVMVTGSIFLGRMIEPIRSTSDPYSKMDMGIPFTGRPDALRFDYRLLMPDTDTRIYSSGFGKQKTLPGRDNAEIFILLQRRWEDADGNLYAARVGTGRQKFGTSTSGWINAYDIPVRYGDLSADPTAKKLIPDDSSYYARNSKGKMVPVHEVKWDNPDAVPTHMIILASTGSHGAYTGTPGLTLWLDNMALVYNQ